MVVQKSRPSVLGPCSGSLTFLSEPQSLPSGTRPGVDCTGSLSCGKGGGPYGVSPKGSRTLVSPSSVRSFSVHTVFHSKRFSEHSRTRPLVYQIRRPLHLPFRTECGRVPDDNGAGVVHRPHRDSSCRKDWCYGLRGFVPSVLVRTTTSTENFGKKL